MKLPAKIFVGLVTGIVVGIASRIAGADALQRFVVALDPVGTAFIKLVTMTVIPLVISSLFVGVASLGDIRTLGRIGGTTLAYFAITTLIAAAIGTGVALLFSVGSSAGPNVRVALASASAAADSSATAVRVPGLVQTLLAMVPQNPFAAAAQADLLPLIVSVCLFAAASTVIERERRRVVVTFFEGVNDLSMVVIGWLMHLAPLAVFLLIAAAIARSGIELLGSLLRYCLVVLVALAVHVVVTLIPILRAGAGMGVMAFFRGVADALLLAFSTASSSVTLPVSMAAAKNRLGLPNEVVSFVLPAGATLNKNGAAVYKAVTAVFLAQLYGLDLDTGRLLIIVLTSTLAGFAGAGVPGSSLVTTLIVLNAIGLGPRAAAGIALVAGIDRPLDMCRTMVNTIGNLVGTAFVARSAGRTERIQATPAGVPAG
jgi:Na+/H+-dicarboxylate symporter